MTDPDLTPRAQRVFEQIDVRGLRGLVGREFDALTTGERMSVVRALAVDTERQVREADALLAQLRREGATVERIGIVEVRRAYLVETVLGFRALLVHSGPR